MGSAVLCMPTANPPITLVAWPVALFCTMLSTGLRPMLV
jgi:hypothetical protein